MISAGILQSNLICNTVEVIFMECCTCNRSITHAVWEHVTQSVKNITYIDPNVSDMNTFDPFPWSTC